MKLKNPLTAIPVCIALALLMQSTVSFAAGTDNDGPKEENVAKKGKVFSSKNTSRNNSSVRIYPDILKRMMHVVAKDNNGSGIDFFVFDLEGTIVKHYKMKSGDHKKLTDLEIGKYVFSVFSGDEETAAGSFDIR